MPRPGCAGNHGAKSRLMELSKLAAAFASLIAIWTGGCARDEQDHAREHMHHVAAEQDPSASRPYVAVSLAELELHPVGGAKFGLPLNIPNLGQMPADTHIRCVVKYSATQDSTMPGLDNVAEEHRVIPPGASESITAFSQEPITPAQADDIQRGRGWIYLVAEVSYNGHAARVCQEFPIIGAKAGGPYDKPAPAQLARYSLCGEPRSNYFD